MKHAVVRLWNSYNFGIVASSKTYAPSAISDAKKQRKAARRSVAGFNAQEHLMLDILMSALALAFFAAAIGYTYACERL
jgi:hypothetical protein